MSFIWPVMLLSLLTLPIFGWLYWRAQQKRQTLTANFGGFGLAHSAGGRRLGLRRHLPPGLFLLGLIILFLALARPQTEVSLPRLEGTIILTFDVSGSMAADDVPPSRMEAAKAAARAFVEAQPATVRIGVVSFSDGGFAVQAPTNDQETILAAINRLSPQRATSLARGILVSLNAIAEDVAINAPADESAPPTPIPARAYASEIIVLISDGENTVNPDPLEAALVAAENGVRVYTVGVGTTNGAMLTVDGFNIQTMLDETMLQQIAAVTGGEYYNAQNEEDFDAIYNDITPQLVIRPETMEVTALFAGMSILILLAGGLLSLVWFGRLP